MHVYAEKKFESLHYFSLEQLNLAEILLFWPRFKVTIEYMLLIGFVILLLILFWLMCTRIGDKQVYRDRKYMVVVLTVSL